MPKNASFKKTYKKKTSGYRKSGTKYTKRYGRKTGPTFKKNVKYGGKYTSYAPSVKRKTVSKFVKRKNLGVSKYSTLQPLNWYSNSLANNTAVYQVVYLTGKPVELHNALLRYTSKDSSSTDTKAIRVVGQEASLEFCMAPTALLQNSGQDNVAEGAEVDVYIFVARRDISNTEYSASISTLNDLYSNAYTVGTNDATTSDLTDPHFTPFMNIGFCRLMKCIRKESFRLGPATPTHIIAHKSSYSARFDDKEEGLGNMMALKGLTTCAVVHWRGQLGLNNGNNTGAANLGWPTYSKPPQIGAVRKQTVNYIIDETFTNENYYLDTLVNPVGTDAIMVSDVANTVKPVPV